MRESHNWRAKPERPTLTPAFVMGFVLWASCAAFYANAKSLSIDACFTWGILAGATSILVVPALVCKRFPRMVAITAISVCMGVLLASFDASSVKMAENEMRDLETIDAFVVLEEDSSPSASGEKALALLEGNAMAEHVTLYFKSEDALLQGERLHVNAKVHASEFDDSDYLWSRASSASLYVVSCERLEDASLFGRLKAVREKALGAFDGGTVESGMLKAITCGYRHDIDGSYEYRAFQTCGLAHLVAVSGAHLVIVVGIVLAILNSMGAPRWLTVLLTVPVMLAYLVLAAMPASAIRATIMSTIAILSFYGKRRPSAMNALGIGMCAMLAIEPHQAVAASFCLSCLSTAGIIMFSPLLSYWFERLPVLCLGIVGQPLSLTISAGILSQLYAVSLFGIVPLLSPIANIACAPLFPLVCGSGIFAALVHVIQIPGLALIGIAASKCAEMLVAVVVALSAVPYASIPFQIGTLEAFAVSFTVGAVLWAAWMKLDVRLASVALVACFVCFAVYDQMATSGDAVIMLDVGQGDSILVRSNGQSMLVDTGNQDSKLISALGRNGVRHIDEVLLTHADDDHVGSLDALASCVEIDRIIVAQDMLTCSDESCCKVVECARHATKELVGASVGDEFSVGSFRCRVIWPHGYKDAGGNSDSLCLLTAYDGDCDGAIDTTALFLGDAESEELGEMMREQRLPSIDIVKVGHHGSKNGITEDEAECLHPAIALIGVGKNNRYGHPSEETLGVLQDVGCSVFRTDEQGDITCSLRADGVTVRTMK